MMTTISAASGLALLLLASPLAAQINPRGDDDRRTSDRVSAVEAAIEAARRRAGVYGERTDTRSGSTKVPPGHLPPRGMCRVWIDGVPPGHQPEPTSCAQAERDRFRYSNARVIYGDRDSFPGKGKGKGKVKRDEDRWDDRIRWGDDQVHDGRSKGKAKIRGKKDRG